MNWNKWHALIRKHIVLRRDLYIDSYQLVLGFIYEQNLVVLLLFLQAQVYRLLSVS